MSEMDLFGALGGGGMAPPGGGAGMSPPGGSPPPGDGPAPASLTSQSSGEPASDAARQAIDFVRTALEAESDDEDLVMLQKVMSDLQSYLAKQQKTADTALGMGPGQKFLRKQTAMSGGGSGGAAF